MSLLTYDRRIEDSIGIFDLALSFASDASQDANVLSAFAQFHNIRCYHYQNHVVEQSGLDIWAVMRYVYASSRRIAIVNSPLYRKSKSTKFEHRVIARRLAPVRLYIVECGGQPIRFTRHAALTFSSISNETALNIVLDHR